MPIALSRELRADLANVTKAARLRAEDAARAALENLAVHERQARGHMDEAQKKLRTHLRARGKALGDTRHPDGTQTLTHLIEHAAYEHWHRLLFTRFLTENHLLLMPDEGGGAPMPVTVKECEELASEMGARDGFDLACRFAGKTLPGVFRADDPVLELALAPEGQVALRKLLESLPGNVFTADDALGWTYQFWQEQRKKDVNEAMKTGLKVGASEISPVTQLFTEDYMVEFLLHNTLGAWWVGKATQTSGLHGAAEADARAAVAIPPNGNVPGIDWTYLRLVQDEATKTWHPAAGTFTGWPKTVRAFTMLDPSMGSGHFLVFALPLLVRLRMAEENLSAAAAVAAVISDNIYGLEIDERCTQIAAFNLALAAWKIGGYQPLPQLHLACSGLAPNSDGAEWAALAGDNDRLQRGMKRLYALFKDAPVLGSLINPRATGGDLIEADFHELQPLLEIALKQEVKNEVNHELAVIARGMAKAAEILSGEFTLVVTNVPYLGRGKQDDILMSFNEQAYPEAKADLATCFAERCLEFCEPNGSAALVTPQNWLFLGSYRKLREKLLPSVRWDFVSRLGAKGFQTPMWDFNIMLIALSKAAPGQGHKFAGFDVTQAASPDSKIKALPDAYITMVEQASQLKNPDCRIVQREGGTTEKLLSERAVAYQGLITGDRNSFIFQFWEVEKLTTDWEVFVDGFSGEGVPLGRENIILWERGGGRLYQMAEINRDRLHDMHESGNVSWGKRGVLLTRIGLRATPYYGERYDNNLICITPHNPDDLSALWSFCSSPEYRSAVRELDQKLSLTNATACKVGVNLDDWVDRSEFPIPETSNPTLYLFNGSPKGCDQPLHVAVARLLGYRWPRQTGSSFPDCAALASDGLETFADHDGIVCLPPILREAPAAARLRTLLSAALGTYDERALLAVAGPKGSKSKTLEEWLRDEFFEQHSALFIDRPFVWHIWDGLKDGFHALVNYHRLDNATLQKLTYSYLGEWIRQQSDDAKADKPGAATRLGAAQALQQKLAAILEGEAPLDIFIRWKPIKEQPVGWHPDHNDGVRQNIRPYLLAGDVGKKGAGVFRVCPLELKDKDRGNEPERPKSDYPWFWCEDEPGTDPKGDSAPVGTRWNTVHLTLANKRAARA